MKTYLRVERESSAKRERTVIEKRQNLAIAHTGWPIEAIQGVAFFIRQVKIFEHFFELEAQKRVELVQGIEINSTLEKNDTMADCSICD